MLLTSPKPDSSSGDHEKQHIPAPKHNICCGICCFFPAGQYPEDESGFGDSINYPSLCQAFNPLSPLAHDQVDTELRTIPISPYAVLCVWCYLANVSMLPCYTKALFTFDLNMRPKWSNLKWTAVGYMCEHSQDALRAQLRSDQSDGVQRWKQHASIVIMSMLACWC